MHFRFPSGANPLRNLRFDGLKNALFRPPSGANPLRNLRSDGQKNENGPAEVGCLVTRWWRVGGALVARWRRVGVALVARWRRVGGALVTLHWALVKWPILVKMVKNPLVFCIFFSVVVDPPVELFFFFFLFFFLFLKLDKQHSTKQLLHYKPKRGGSNQSNTPGGAKPLGGFNRFAHSAGPSLACRLELGGTQF